MYIESTIAAISTPPGIGGIGVIRISGNKSLQIIDKLFVSPTEKKISEIKSHSVNYGYIVECNSRKTIDEVIILIMKKPNSYTKEDVVEIQCHGGIVSTKLILEEVLKSGAELAEPGEFAKRAFLNGRIDLLQAEAISDIIYSKTNYGLRNAVNQLEGELSKKISSVRNEIISLVSHLQAIVDFPEEDIEELSSEKIEFSLKNIYEKLEYLLDTAESGKILKDGVKTAIIGKPNVGKSSFLNAMVRENRAIVTEIPGTTRDVIEEYVNIKGIPLRMMDTAGIRETDDIVEKIGVEKSREILNSVDFIIFIIDGSIPLSESDYEIINIIKDKKSLVIINKSDLPRKINIVEIVNIFRDKILECSLLKNEGLDKVEEFIYHMFYSGLINSKDETLITNVRQKDALFKAAKNLEESLIAIDSGMPIDMVSIDLTHAIDNLGEMIGLTISEEIVDRIFHDFCLGK